MQEKQKYTFRRIRGKIVPIRVKEKKEGFGTIAAGVAIAAATAEGAARAVKTSAKIRIRAGREFKLASALMKAAKRSPEQLTLGLEKQVAKNFATKLAAKRLGSRLLFKARNPILAVGAIVSTSLINTGIDKVQNDKRIKTSERVLEESLGHAVVGGAIGALYYKRLDVKSFGQALRFAIMRVKKIPRGTSIPIKAAQETLKF